MAHRKPVYSVAQAANYLKQGYWGGESFHFDARPGDVLTVDVSGLTADGQTQAARALDAWSSISGLCFSSVTGGADITFDDEDTGAYANFSYDGSNLIRSSTVNIERAWAGGGAATNSYVFQTYLHEIGHALGLGHAGNYNGSASYGRSNIYANDSWQMSIMSYFSQSENWSVKADFAYAITPMQADIAAIHALYGTPATRLGDTVYGTMGNTGSCLDDFASLSGPVTMTIWDDGGTDRIDLSASGEDQVVDMAPGAVSDILGRRGNLVIAQGTMIEDLCTGAGSDVVRGNNAGNRILLGDGDDAAYGRNGNDVIEGGGGADRLYGDAGDDFLDGGDGADLMSGDAGNDILHGGAGDDRLYGSVGNDSLYGDDGADLLDGSKGNDILYGGAGDDRLYGSVGNDSLFGDDGADLLDGSKGNDILHGGAGDDRLYGSVGNDSLFGDDGADLLDGSKGNDILHGGEGDDRLYGSKGNDRLFGDGGADVLSGSKGNDVLEGGSGDDRLWGSKGNDILAGGADADWLDGGVGNDRLDGGDGDDLLYGGKGRDVLVGGAGDDLLWGGKHKDVFVFADGCGSDTVMDMHVRGKQADRIDLSGLTEIVDWNDLWADHLSNGAEGCLIDAGFGDTILLNGLSMASLGADDFLF